MLLFLLYYLSLRGCCWFVLVGGLFGVMFSLLFVVVGFLLFLVSCE